MVKYVSQHIGIKVVVAQQYSYEFSFHPRDLLFRSLTVKYLNLFFYSLFYY
jgi:hypothetical protein